MKRIVLIGLFAALIANAYGQDKLFTRTGHIWFFSHTPIEDIEAHNKQVSSIIDKSNGGIVFSVPMIAFQFKKALMEEHFNENYVETDTYPNATFKGTIKNIKDVDFSKDGQYPVTVSGNLTIHGVTKPVETKGILEKKGDIVHGSATFTISPEDYNIEIPGIVRDKIAKTLDVHVDIDYKPFEK